MDNMNQLERKDEEQRLLKEKREGLEACFLEDLNDRDGTCPSTLPAQVPQADLEPPSPVLMPGFSPVGQLRWELDPDPVHPSPVNWAVESPGGSGVRGFMASKSNILIEKVTMTPASKCRRDDGGRPRYGPPGTAGASFPQDVLVPCCPERQPARGRPPVVLILFPANAAK